MLHKGHRQRVKARILLHGTDALHYHERLEALLFYAIPYRDTNPAAHLLADRFPSASTLFRATREELVSLSGIGEYTADLLLLLGEIYRYYVNCKLQNIRKSAFSSMEEIAAYGKERMRTLQTEATYLLMLNNKMEPVAFEKILDGHPQAPAFTLGHIVRPAFRHHASFVVLFHNHLSDIAIPSGDDLSLSQSLLSRLRRLDTPILEHFLVAGERHRGLLCHSLEQGKRQAGSLHSAPRFSAAVYSDTERRARERELCIRLARYIGGAAEERFLSLLDTYSLASLIEGDRGQSIALLGENAAVLLQLLFALFSGAEDGEKEKKSAFGPMDAARIVAKSTRGLTSEAVYVFLLDASDRLIAYEKCGEGVPGAVPIQPRRLLEYAVYREAPKMILAHTHPNGHATPSTADVRLTHELSALFSEAGVTLLSHIVVTETGYAEVTDEACEGALGGRMNALLDATRTKE